VTFDPETGKLLGVQGVGGAGADKRINVLAVTTQAGMTVFDLEEVDCVRPAVRLRERPGHHGGFRGRRVAAGRPPQTDWEAVAALIGKPLLLDVRTSPEFTNGHISDAVNIPVDELRRSLGELPEGPSNRRLMSGRSAGLDCYPHPDVGRFPHIDPW